jgi:hypothetical protein
MSLAQLQHASTSPSKFTSLLRHHSQISNGSVQPLSRRVLAPRPLAPIPSPISPNDLTEDDSFVHLCLVPGGRWLITLTESNLMQLWDLGLAADSMIKPLPLATISLGEGASVQFPPDVQVNRAGDGLLVAMLYDRYVA